VIGAVLRQRDAQELTKAEAVVAPPRDPTLTADNLETNDQPKRRTQLESDSSRRTEIQKDCATESRTVIRSALPGVSDLCCHLCRNLFRGVKAAGSETAEGNRFAVPRAETFRDKWRFSMTCATPEAAGQVPEMLLSFRCISGGNSATL
jgi:hypothetical protein